MGELQVKSVYRVVVGLFCLGMIGLALLVMLTPSIRYRLFGSEEALNDTLATQVRPGDSRATVADLLGPGQLATPERTAKLKAGIESHMERYGNGFPHGVTESDLFVGYDVAGGTTYLQFRDGRLVNHDPAAYAAAEQVRALD